MGLRQMAGFGRSPSEAKGESAPIVFDRCLSLMVQGAAQNMPEIDAATYNSFRKRVSEESMQVPDRSPVEDKLAKIQAIVREFESYRKGAEGELKERQKGWRALVSMQLQELLERVGVDAGSADAAPLVLKIAGLETGEQIQAYRERLKEFLHPSGAEQGIPVGASKLKAADRTTENDNAAGLRGGGAAVEHVKLIMEQGSKGFIALFRLGCMETISQRFGVEAVQDSLMAVSAFLTHNLHSGDAIFHWSDSSLLVVLEGRPNVQILTAELQRIVAQNRDITVNIENRIVMLRIPLDFDLTPISYLHSAEDVYKLTPKPVTQW
jgi:GGDEF domain-containing protein